MIIPSVWELLHSCLFAGFSYVNCVCFFEVSGPYVISCALRLNVISCMGPDLLTV